MIPILSTKTLTTQQKSKLFENGFSLTEFDFIQIHFVDFKLDNLGDLLLFTSQNAVKSVLKHPKANVLKSIPCICVGEKTAKLLSENNWKIIHYEAYASNLGDYINQNCLKNRITFFSGNLRRDVLPNILKKNKIEHSEIQVYKTVLHSERIDFPQKAILFFSPSGIQSFLQKNYFSDEIIFCIGKTTANEALKHTKNYIVSENTTIESLIECVIAYFLEKTH
ncbi:uroporphyrinogen-III synthase [Capnocytophaga felis]|uniref:Uroporphyrinogen III methyltransferase n=1 Tax=Capnocytophaga felis TaxID=2267611 RepID=A0A5M4B5Z7_9FLAO|nr:uroporphyrinogen-III synthase [Capnocytophaga felis]GET45034.1 uroporphyrinogen III methyltransferase [Capnocytophaga felis]GET47802.1 uroporphyrinogen III methyltransferase [Capnocytophaga felis]